MPFSTTMQICISNRSRTSADLSEWDHSSLATIVSNVHTRSFCHPRRRTRTLQMVMVIMGVVQSIRIKIWIIWVTESASTHIISTAGSEKSWPSFEAYLQRSSKNSYYAVPIATPTSRLINQVLHVIALNATKTSASTVPNKLSRHKSHANLRTSTP